MVAELIDHYHETKAAAERAIVTPYATADFVAAATVAAADARDRLLAALDHYGPVRHGSRVYWLGLFDRIGRRVQFQQWTHDAADVRELAAPTTTGA